MMEDQKRFESWSEVDCNQCVHYWSDACDGIKEGVKKPCSSFLAHREITIPKQIESLDKRIKRLRLSILCCILANLLLLLTIWLEVH